jgi:hypothetical protein
MKAQSDKANAFSEDCKTIIAYAFEKTFYLGSTIIEPIHLILGEIDHQYNPGIAPHLFKDQAHIDRVTQKFKRGDPLPIPEDNGNKPVLSKKFEQVIRKSYSRAKALGAELVEPFHMFIVLEEIDPQLINDLTEGDKFDFKAFYLKTYGLNLYRRKDSLLQKIRRFFKGAPKETIP